MKTAILLLDGVLDSSVALTLDVLHAANRLLVLGGQAPRFEPALVGAKRAVRSGCGLRYTADARISGPDRWELIFVPGLNVPLPAELAERLARPEIGRVSAWLAAQHRAGALVAGSCVGTFLLAEAGLLGSGPATTSWWLGREFSARYPDIELHTERMVTRGQRVLCGGAALAQMDVALAVVTQLAGPRLAHLVARYLVLDRRPSQARYAIASHLAAHHEDVEAAEGWIRRHLAEDFDVQRLARATGVSTRTLARRIRTATGTSPVRFVQRVRAEQAVHLLQTTTLSIEGVAERVGYANASTLRRILRREMGASARELRSVLRSTA